MSLHIAPKVMARMPLTAALGTEPFATDEESVATSSTKPQRSSLYTLAVIVRIGVLGTILFHALTLWSW